MNKKKMLMMSIPYVIFGYFCDKVAYVYRISKGDDMIESMMFAINHMDKAFTNPLPSIHYKDLVVGIIGGLALYSIVLYRKKNAKKFRHGVEYGSARWGTSEDIQPYMSKKFQDNIILTATERLTMGKASKPKYARNKNVLVIGGSGSGKTRFFVKPNLMQMHSSYVLTDPKGTVLIECGKMLKDNGYQIRVLNTINFKKSNHYNPFAYIRDEKDILKLVNTIIVNTKGEGAQATEDFWVKAERLLYTAYIGFIWFECVELEQNFITLLDMIDASETREDDENFKNAIDLLFEELEADEPDHFAVKQYKKYKLAAGVITYKRLLMMFIG